jgi:hypothetical protein
MVLAIDLSAAPCARMATISATAACSPLVGHKLAVLAEPEAKRSNPAEIAPPPLLIGLRLPDALADTVAFRRKAFPNAFSNGLSVIEQTPRDQKAVDELLSVAGTLYTQEIADGHPRTPRRNAA